MLLPYSTWVTGSKHAAHELLAPDYGSSSAGSMLAAQAVQSALEAATSAHLADKMPPPLRQQMGLIQAISTLNPRAPTSCQQHIQRAGYQHLNSGRDICNKKLIADESLVFLARDPKTQNLKEVRVDQSELLQGRVQ